MKRLISLSLTLFILLAGCPVVFAHSFADVPPDIWYSPYVSSVTELGVFNGTSPTTFSPNDQMTRGMFVTALGRYAKAPSSGIGSTGIITKDSVNMREAPNTESTIVAVFNINTIVQINGVSGSWYNVQYGGKSGYIRNDLMEPYGTAFTDIPAAMYYTSYVEWASSKKIVSGTSSTTFSPDANITREQICTILNNYAASINLRIEPKYDKRTFTDDTSFQSWASDSIYVMQQAGIITGREDGSFAGGESATRAEVAAILSRFIDCVSYKPDPMPQPNTGEAYSFGTAVPETAAVTDSYFDDTAFIGNSFVDGMRSFFALPETTFYGVTGISAASMLTYSGIELEETFENEDGEIEHKTGTLAEALAENEGSFKKIYLVFGTNELGPKERHRTEFHTALISIIDLVRVTQPDAKIYLVSTLPLSQARSEESENYNRDNALSFNNVIKQVSLEKSAYYLDVFRLFANGDGYLPEDHCLSDGVHILRPQYETLKNFLKTHTI